MTTEFAVPESREVNGQMLKEKAAAARAAVADLAVETKHFVGGRLATLKTHTGEKAKQVNESVVSFVGRNPYKTIAIAAGVGLLAGMLLKRR